MARNLQLLCDLNGTILYYNADGYWEYLKFIVKHDDSRKSTS